MASNILRMLKSLKIKSGNFLLQKILLGDKKWEKNFFLSLECKAKKYHLSKKHTAFYLCVLHTLVSKFTTTQQLNDAIDPNVFRINLKKLKARKKTNSFNYYSSELHRAREKK